MVNYTEVATRIMNCTAADLKRIKDYCFINLCEALTYDKFCFNTECNYEKEVELMEILADRFITLRKKVPDWWNIEDHLYPSEPEKSLYNDRLLVMCNKLIAARLMKKPVKETK